MLTRVELRRVTTRKLHVCEECGTRIEIGSECYDDVLKDGEVYHYRAHVDCYDCAMEWGALQDFTLSADGREPLINDDSFLEELDQWVDKYPTVVARIKSRRSK